jgi:hypothetical protein
MCRKGSSQNALVSEFASYVKLLPLDLKKKYSTNWFPTLMRILQAQLGVQFTPSTTTDVCPNDCVLYRQAWRDHIMCPNFGCDASRYGPDGMTPARQFTFLYMIPRVRRMFASFNWSTLLEYVTHRPARIEDWITDVVDASAYLRLFGNEVGKLLISKYNMAVSFGADGLPISKRDKTYSTTPLLFHMCALCPALRCLWDFLFCTGFTPGPGKNNTALFLQQVAEEFKRAWDIGFMVWDVLTGGWHRVRMALLFGIFDLRGTAAVTDGNQSPAIAHCHLCDVKGEYIKEYNATYYNGDWTHLPANCPLRAACQARQFPGMPDPPTPVLPRTEASAAAACDLAEASRYVLTSKKHPSKLHYYKKHPWLRKFLSYWPYVNGVLVDPPHTQSNLGKTFAKFSLCAVRVGKKSRRLTPSQVKYEMARGFGRIGEIVDGIGPWAMAPAEIAAFNLCITSVKIPRTKGGRLKPPLVPVNVGRMKMNSWQRIIGHLGVWALYTSRAFSHDPRYRGLWVNWFNYWQLVWARRFRERVLPLLQKRAHRLHGASGLLLPASALGGAFHAQVHMPINMAVGGPVNGNNMYVDERAGHTLTRASQACRGFEVGFTRAAILRDYCSYLRVHDPSLFEDQVASAADSGHSSLLPMGADDGIFTLRKAKRVAAPSLPDLSRLDILFPGLRATQLTIFLSAPSAVTKHRLFTDDGGHSSSIRYRTAGELSGWGMVVGIFQCHVLNDVRAPTVAYLEVEPWDCRRGMTCLPILQKLDTPTIFLRPSDVFHDCVLFLPVIDEDKPDGYSHNLIQIDALDLPTFIPGLGNRRGGDQFKVY